MHFAPQPIARLPTNKTGLVKLPKWIGGLHLCNHCQLTFNTALPDFNPGHLKKVAAQVNFCLSQCFSVSRVIRCLKIDTCSIVV